MGTITLNAKEQREVEILHRSSKVPVVVDFWASWCGPCKMVAPAVADLAKEFAGRAMVAKVNVDDNPRVAGRHNVTGELAAPLDWQLKRVLHRAWHSVGPN
jgi:thioredoxin-like negative regulator of GroEL